jgi:hypothetical protein
MKYVQNALGGGCSEEQLPLGDSTSKPGSQATNKTWIDPWSSEVLSESIVARTNQERWDLRQKKSDDTQKTKCVVFSGIIILNTIYAFLPKKSSNDFRRTNHSSYVASLKRTPTAWCNVLSIPDLQKIITDQLEKFHTKILTCVDKETRSHFPQAIRWSPLPAPPVVEGRRKKSTARAVKRRDDEDEQRKYEEWKAFLDASNIRHDNGHVITMGPEYYGNPFKDT